MCHPYPDNYPGGTLYEIDFLAVENEDQDGGKSGDAITLRFTLDAENREAVVVIDGGFTDIGEKVVQHIQTHYKTDHADLVISTHPDADHLNGLPTILEQLKVDELMVHQPRLHTKDVSDFSNLEALDHLLEVASIQNVKLVEPFTGTTRFGGQLLVMGPSESYYDQLLAEQLKGEDRASASAGVMAVKRGVWHLQNLVERALTLLPTETLTDEGETTARNNSSVITLVSSDGDRFMLTGDAGVPALERAADYYEQQLGSFARSPLSFLQAPHHGSKRNVGPTILDRVLGKPGATHASDCASFISSARAAIKHPSPKVVNALSRRGCSVIATEGKAICHRSSSAPQRAGWSPIQPLPALAEDADED